MQRFGPLEDVDAVFPFVIADEGDAVRLAVAQHDRRNVPAERVGELLQLTRVQVERPDVVDVAVLRDLRMIGTAGSVAVEEKTIV